MAVGWRSILEAPKTQGQLFIRKREAPKKGETTIYNYASGTKIYWNPIAGKFQKTTNIKEPKYTFGEAMGLAQYGYTGLFGRGEKKTLGLLGENYQQIQALANYRAGITVPKFGLQPDAPQATLNRIAAAESIGQRRYNSLIDLYQKFNEKYGADAAGYISRYGAKPSVDSKYGILFNVNTAEIVRDDVSATYQNNLAKTMIKAGKMLSADNASNEDKALGVFLTSLGMDSKITSTRARANRDKISAMEEQLGMLQDMYSPEVQASLSAANNAQMPEGNYSRNTTGVLTGLLSTVATGNPLLGFNVGRTTEGNDMVGRALDYMSGLSEHDILKGREVWWKDSEKPEGATWDSKGLIGLHVNWTKGLARFGLGLPAGIAAVTGEAGMVLGETKAVVTGEKETWGEGVDFQIGDAIWADYARRYYDPFAYKVDENGNYVFDDKGNRIEQGFWKGVVNQDNYDAWGNVIALDPLALTLDLLDVAPVVGAVGKGAGAASLAGRVPRYNGRVGITRADKVALDIAQKRAADVEEAVEAIPAAARENAESIIAKLNENPELLEVLDDAQIREAAEILRPVEELSAAKLEVEAAERKLATAPTPRNFRRIARAAINGDAEAMRRIEEWRAKGLEFNGAENKWEIRLGALFDERTKVLDKPESVLEASDKAIIRLPASPIVRGLKEGWYWVGRKAEAAAARKLADADAAPGIGTRIANKWIDFPRLGYRWSYTKAIQNEEIYNWGDMTSEMYRASRLLEIDGAASLTIPQRQAIEAQLFGGTGERGAPNAPQVQRQAIYDKLRALPRDKKGNVLPAARNDEATLNKKLDDLLDRQLRDVDERLAAESFDEQFQDSVDDLRARIANPEYKAGDVQIDQMMDLYRRMLRQDEAIRHRLVHEDTSPTTINYLRQLYAEAMNGLRLTENHLFGKRGRLQKYTQRVLRPNNAMAMYLTRLVNVDDADEILSAAQRMDAVGTVFDGLEPSVRKQRERELVRAVEALVEDNAGIFRDGLGGAGEIGRPVLVLAREQTAGPDFVQFHLPRLRHHLDNGRVDNGVLVDEGEIFTMPKVFFASRNKGKGKVILENSADGKSLLETGALNAMADVYPNARFFSEKIAETGQQGIRMNERMVKTESVIAHTALREHSLAQAIRSQVNYFMSRIERDIAGLAEQQAVLIPARLVSGKDPAISGYRVLDNVRVFDNINDARDFARLRGVLDEFEKTAKLYEDGNLDVVDSTLDIPAGMGIRLREDGSTEFIVRGGVQDWAPYAINESLEQHSLLSAYRSTMYTDPVDIPDHGFVLAVPNQVDRQLSNLVIEGNDFATRLLNNPMLKGGTNIFKWLVLNFNPKFIANNVIGGLTMLMIHNPAAAPKILFRMAQSIARKNGDARMSNIVREADAITRQMQYEFNLNIYRRDSHIYGDGLRNYEPQGIRDLSNKHEWFRKYVQNFGYTTISAFEQFVRKNVAIDYLKQDPTFNAFMLGDEVADYIRAGVDWHGNVRQGDDAITPFEAAVDLLLDRNSPFFNAELKHRMRYTTNTVSGNYHRFSATEQLMRNFLMPFYAWQRHSLTYTYRLAIDKPITTNVLYNVGQYGYVEASQSGVPDWMMMTVPLPDSIKELIGIEEDDFRIDANALSPFSTTGDMAAAAVNLLTGTDLGANVFEFANPYVNQIIKDTLGVDPRTGRFDFTGEQSGKGFFSALYDTASGVGKGTYAGRAKGVYDAINAEYEADGLANKYPAIDNAIDILKNQQEGEPFSEWRLSIPEERSTIRTQGNLASSVLAAVGITNYRLNLDAVEESQRAEIVGAYVLNRANNAYMLEKSQEKLNGVENWQRRRDYTYEVWLPQAEAQGLDPSVIQLVLAKIEDEKPDDKKSQALLAMLGG